MSTLTIRARIVLWFVVLTALLLAAFSTAVVLRSRVASYSALDDSLRSRAAAMAALIESDHGHFEVEFAGEMLPSADLRRSFLCLMVIFAAPPTMDSGHGCAWRWVLSADTLQCVVLRRQPAGRCGCRRRCKGASPATKPGLRRLRASR